MPPIPHARPEDLLDQVGWMHDLARSLLSDSAAADDVVQDVCIAALVHPPLADRPLEPWLARVVRNLAWKRRRGEARRALHERAASTREPAPSPQATAERLELQRTVLAAIEAVAEPFRTTVVERYLEGRSSAEIARALGVPEGTVRWRLKRGLDELRARLDARFGRREAWTALLVPLVPLVPVPAPTGGAPPTLAFPSGVLTMIAASKLVLVAALGAAAVGFVLWRSGQPTRGGKGEVAGAGAPAPVQEPARLLPVEPAPATRVEPSTHAAAPELGTAVHAPAAASAPGAPPTEARLRLRFVDVNGAPWSDVAVLELRSEVPRATSGTDGRVELTLSRWASEKKGASAEPASEWTVELLARRTGCATLVLRAALAAGRTTDLGDVLLEPGGRIEGRVLDEAGVALAGAEVGLAPPEPFGPEPRDEGLLRRCGAPGFERETSGTGDTGGAFVLDGVTPGRWRLWAHAEGMRYGWTEPFEVEAASVSRLDVRLPALLATDSITGIVLDPAGAPLPGARLTTSYQLENEGGSSTQDVGPDGRFDLVLQRDTTYSFVASDPEHRYADALALDVEPGARELELRLGEKRTFEVSARDRDGQAVDSCRFDLRMEVAGAVVSDEAPPEHRGPGLYALALPARTFRLAVEADGYLPVRLDELRPENVGARLEVVLDRAPVLRGRVRAQGEPVPDAHVALHRPVGEQSYARNGFHCVYEYDALSEATTDGEGRFELTCVSNEPVWLRAASPGWVAGELGPLDPLSAHELAVELTLGGAIEGRVLLPDGADGAGIVVGLNHGDGRGRTQRAGPDGRFRFDNLVPGRWQVLRRDAELDPNTISISSGSDPVEIEWSCTVVAGETTHHDLDLTRR